MTKRNLIVLSSVPPPSACTTTIGTGSYALDLLDDFNHPRQRRDSIWNALQRHANCSANDEEANTVHITFDTSTSTAAKVMSIEELSTLFHGLYSTVHSTQLLTFLETAWDNWVALGHDGRDPIGCAAGAFENNNTTVGTCTTNTPSTTTTDNTTSNVNMNNIPSLIPACTPLMRCHNQSTKQRASQHVIGQVSYYCTDTCTPIFHHLKQEMYSDTQLLQNCLERIQTQTDSSHDHATDDNHNQSNNHHHSVYYIIPNHPGHHAAYDCFGGYCYVNHIAALAKNIVKSSSSSSSSSSYEKVVILDVDYHCGNGTAAIFQQQEDENVMVISIHCDPDYDYPFHIGFRDDSTSRVIHLPLPPGTGWDSGYRLALLEAIRYIHDFHPTTLLVSLGIDTFENDPCTIRRAGFTLHLDDYSQMGSLLATEISESSSSSSLHRTIFVQEGGYRMDVIGDAARNVVLSYAQHLM